MLRRSTYLLALGTMALIAWAAATDLAAKVLLGLAPGFLERLSAITAGSATSAIVLAAGVVALLPALLTSANQWIRTWRLIASAHHHGCEPVADFDALWSQFARTFGIPPSERPKRALSCDTSVVGSGGLINGSVLLLSHDVADRLALGRERHHEEYDYASLVLLHELGHWRSGDAHLSVARDALAVTCAGLIGFGIAISSARVLQPMFLVEVMVLTILASAGLLGMLRQISRQVEYDADAWAARQIARVHGEQAAAAAIERFSVRLGAVTAENADDERLPPLAARPLEGLLHHPAPARRIVALRSRPAAWPMVILWMAALVALVWTQSERVDPHCGDCGQYYQIWFDALAWITVIMLTGTVLRLGHTGMVEGQPLGLRLAAILGVWLVYITARYWVSADGLAAIWHHYGPALAVTWVFYSNDAYTLASTLHLSVAAGVILWPQRRSRATTRRALREPLRKRPLASFHPRRIWREVEVLAGAVGLGVSFCFLSAGVAMLVGPLLSGFIHPASPSWWGYVAGTATVIVVSWLATFRLPGHIVPAAIVLGVEAAIPNAPCP